MADVIRNEIITLVDKELKAANERFGLNHSNHESYAVLCEEIDEAHEELAKADYHKSRIWDATKRNTEPQVIRALYANAYSAAIDLAAEAVQVAAMARKAIISNIEFTEKKEGGQEHDKRI